MFFAALWQTHSRKYIAIKNKLLNGFASCFCVAGRVEKLSWCTARWAFHALAPRWSLMPWRSSTGRWMWPWLTWRIADLSLSPTTVSWSSCKSTAASSTQGQIQSSEVAVEALCSPAVCDKQEYFTKEDWGHDERKNRGKKKYIWLIKWK